MDRAYAPRGGVGVCDGRCREKVEQCEQGVSGMCVMGTWSGIGMCGGEEDVERGEERAYTSTTERVPYECGRVGVGMIYFEYSLIE